jgi:hypothetical protein
MCLKYLYVTLKSCCAVAGEKFGAFSLFDIRAFFQASSSFLVSFFLMQLLSKKVLSMYTFDLQDVWWQ